MIVLTEFQNVGESYPYEWVRFDPDTQLWYQGEVQCTGSVMYGGTCRCISHDPYKEWVVGREDVKSLLKETLDRGIKFDLTREEIESLERPTLQDLIMERLALHDIESFEELESWLSSSYKLGFNPLPALRRVVGDLVNVQFMHADRQTFYYDEEPALLVKLHDNGAVEIEMFEP